MKKKGFTLIEILIVFAILTTLIIMAWMSWKNQINKANDADRKTDIERLQIAFEEYYSDNGHYPPANILNNCNGDELSPYLESIPCDPTTYHPYCYVVDTEGVTYQNFRILASFQNDFDSIISELGCDGPDFCGWEEECIPTGDSEYNFGLSSTNVTIANPNMPDPPTGPPVDPSIPPHEPGNWACTPAGECDNYGAGANCPVSFSDDYVELCTSWCPTSDPSQRCD